MGNDNQTPEEEVNEKAEASTEAAENEEVKETSEAPAETAADEVKEEVKEEAPKEEPKASPKEEKPALTGKLGDIVTTIEKLSVLELAELVKALQDRFGVSPMAMAAPAAGGATGGASAEPAEEQTVFNVILADGGANKIGAIKAVREIVPTLGLKEAKDLVEAAPKPVLEGVGKEAAEEAKKKLTEAGGTVELQ